MDTVKEWADVSENIGTLEKYATSHNENKQFHLKLVKNGTCFIAYQQNQRIHFAPSRFVGYTHNTMKVHIANKSKDGRVTNPAINKILGDAPQINSGLEFEYKKYCQSLGFNANKTGSFGVARKFWFPLSTEDLLKQIQNASTDEKELLSDLKEISNLSNIKTTEKERLVSARIGQGWFREGLINYWKKCAVTKCDEISLLRASHIKPWRYSSNIERLDTYNGILLAPNLDLLFDKGFITFGANGNIQISKKLSQTNAKKLGLTRNVKIHLEHNHMPYLDWHRKNVFLK